jgi:hypothetical protein
VSTTYDVVGVEMAGALINGYSASAVARNLRTSTPRALRTIRRLRMAVPKSPSGAYAITARQLDTLRTELGDPIPVGLTRVQARVLVALARSPRGLASIRSVARRTGVSPPPPAAHSTA